MTTEAREGSETFDEGPYTEADAMARAIVALADAKAEADALRAEVLRLQNGLASLTDKARADLNAERAAHAEENTQLRHRLGIAECDLVTFRNAASTARGVEEAQAAENVRLRAEVAGLQAEQEWLRKERDEAQRATAAHAEAIRVLTLERDAARRAFDAIGRSAEAIRAEERRATLEELKTYCLDTSRSLIDQPGGAAYRCAYQFVAQKVINLLRALAPPSGSPVAAPTGEAAALYTQVCERDCDEDCAAPNGDLMRCPDAPCTLIRCGPASAEKPTEGDAPAAAPTPTGAPYDAQDLIHRSRIPFVAICGADVPNQRTATEGHPFNCLDCIATEKRTAAPTGALGREATSETLAWEDDGEGQGGEQVLFEPNDPENSSGVGVQMDADDRGWSVVAYFRGAPMKDEAKAIAAELVAFARAAGLLEKQASAPTATPAAPQATGALLGNLDPDCAPASATPGALTRDESETQS